mgnify:CR=1 FL=1
MADPTPVVDQKQVVEDVVQVGQVIIANPKGFWKSKTFWIVLTVVTGHYFGLIQANASPYILAGAAIALRLISKDEVTITGNK